MKKTPLLLSFLISMTCVSKAETLYQKPDSSIAPYVQNDHFSFPRFNYQKSAYVKVYDADLPSIQFVAKPVVKLAGLRFNPQNYTDVSNSYTTRLVYVDLKSKKEKPLPFSEDSIIRETAWSFDGKHLAVTVETPKCLEVWLVQIPKLNKSKVPQVCLNTVMLGLMGWVDNEHLILSTKTAAQNKPLAIEKAVPKGPVVQQSFGAVSQNMTFPDLIRTPLDEQKFELAAKSQTQILNIKTKKIKKIGPENLYSSFRYSPDRQYILVETIQKPFPYTVTMGRFASKIELWKSDGTVVSNVHTGGPYENIPMQGVRKGPRSFQWLNELPHTLFYTQALDDGDWEVKADHRDELFLMEIEPNGKLKSKSIYKLQYRFAGVDPIELTDHLFISEYDREREWVTSYLIKKDEKSWQAKTIFSLSENDDYNNPGDFIYRRNKYNRYSIRVDQLNGENTVFLTGRGATPKGNYPFLRSMSLDNLTTKEIFRSKPGRYENFQLFLNDQNTNEFLISSQSPTEPLTYQILNIQNGELKKDLLYADEDPFQKLAPIKKEIVTYRRKDGVQLSGTLYYPANYEKGKKYPAIIQAYPLEYTDATTAGQVRGSQDTYSRPSGSSIVFATFKDYFVLTNAQMPIIGPPETKNDTFIQQLTAGAEAAVQYLVKTDAVDQNRIGVIGHSYGAFMVAHLLTHTNLFSAGVARSGAYNRTLTPNGFQGERRALWKAKETYINLSPFMDAEKVKKPLLLVHGMSDNNPGTFTLQSERYYEALKSQGARVKLVLLPEEGHGYESLESNQHVLYETLNWFDEFLKSKQD